MRQVNRLFFEDSQIVRYKDMDLKVGELRANFNRLVPEATDAQFQGWLRRQINDGVVDVIPEPLAY